MREVGAFEAKNKLSQLLDEVERGEEITITRHGKEVARLVPARQGFNREEAIAVIERRVVAQIETDLTSWRSVQDHTHRIALHLGDGS